MVMDWCGHGLVWPWTGVAMDWCGHGLVWPWTGVAMDWCGHESICCRSLMGEGAL